MQGLQYSDWKRMRSDYTIRTNMFVNRTTGNNFINHFSGRVEQLVVVCVVCVSVYATVTFERNDL